MIFQFHKFISYFSFHAHCSLTHLYTFGSFRKYDLTRQTYLLSPYNDPTRPLFYPQESLNPNDDFILPTQIHTTVANYLQKRTNVSKLLSMTTRVLHIPHVSNNTTQMLNSMLSLQNSSFLLKKQYNNFRATTNVPDEITNALPKSILLPSTNTTDISTSSNLFNLLLPPVFSKLQIQMYASTHFLVLLINLSLKFSQSSVIMLKSLLFQIPFYSSAIFLTRTVLYKTYFDFIGINSIIHVNSPRK